MRDILSKITKWWEAGETFGLATVVRTYRSAPRDPGGVGPCGQRPAGAARRLADRHAASGVL